jgi:hypothetical protein
MQLNPLKRREFISLLSQRAQQSERMRRIGVLSVLMA